VAGFQTTLEFDGAGLEKPLAALRNLRDLGEDLSPFMTAAKSILLASTINRFETGRGPGGIPWAQTKRQVRSAVGPTGPNKARILVNTGALQSSIQGESDSKSAEVGSKGLDVPAKLANQFGSHRQSVVLAHERVVTKVFGATLDEPAVQNVRAHGRVTNLPARPFVGIDSDDVADIKDAWGGIIRKAYGNG